MNLKNKDIAEGMYVINGKDVWKVLDWNSKYTDCLLQKIDKNGNKMDLFMVAENYELYGDEKEPQIAWMNGDYCIEKRQIDAEQYFIDFYKDNKKFKESLKESKIADIAKSLKEVEKKLRKHFSPYDVNWASDEDGDFIVIANKKPFFYYVFDIDLDNMRVTMFEDEKALNSDYIKDVDDCYGAIIGLIEPYVSEEIEEKKNLKESKEFFVGDKTAKGFEVCMIKDGKKYYLSKLAKNVIDSDWSSDHTYAKHWKDKSRAEEVVDMLNSELKESKKVINEKVDSRYKYVFNHTKDAYEIVQFDDYNFEILAIPNDKSVFSNDLPKLKIEKTYIYDTCVNNKDITLFVGIIEELGWCFIAFDKLANNNNIFAYYISGKTKEGAYQSFHEYKSKYNLRCEESKKSARKSLKESAKPINEKNVAKFVDELNKWCDDNVHYKDVDSAKFTKQYGKLYDFGYNWDYSYGDKGDLLVFDKEETLDWYDDEVVVPFIKQLAKKYGWYCEPAHSYADFMFAEL